MVDNNNREEPQIKKEGKFTFDSIVEDAKQFVQSLLFRFMRLMTKGTDYRPNFDRIIICGTLNFEQHVVGWFKKINNLDQKVDTPFVADASQFKDLLGTVPTKPVAIFQGVYNEEADEITHSQYVEADALDDKTQEFLGNEPLIVLQ